MSSRGFFPDYLTQVWICQVLDLLVDSFSWLEDQDFRPYRESIVGIVSDPAELGKFLGSIAGELVYAMRGASPSVKSLSPIETLLRQLEATTHKPSGYATSPSLPGTINSPWWTDYAHLVYWFFFIASFATVVFVWYLYDLKVKRAETAMPVRETRGFSRAQTGDLVTAVLPLTWSATMVMHASTHSINFDENTAGAAFSFTVVAYQWGWNYYFPRDIVAKIESAPVVVGRGRVVFFEASPAAKELSKKTEGWALRALTGSRHCSKTGRQNTTPALSLVLPTDIKGGALAETFLAGDLSRGWRASLNTYLSESTPTLDIKSLEAKLLEMGSPILASMDQLSGPFAFKTRPIFFVSGTRLTVGYRHFMGESVGSPLRLASWLSININISRPQGGQDLSMAGSLTPTPLTTSLDFSNVVSMPLEGKVETPLWVEDKRLDFLRLESTIPSPQHLLWTGPDALTGSFFSSLCSTEDFGWTTPLMANESLSRSANSQRREARSFFMSTTNTARLGSTLLSLPFDLSARALLNHSRGTEGLLGHSWVSASKALEEGISPDVKGTWLSALSPDSASLYLPNPFSPIFKQNVSLFIRNLHKAGAPDVAVMASPLVSTPTPLSNIFSGIRQVGQVEAYILKVGPRPKLSSLHGFALDDDILVSPTPTSDLCIGSLVLRNPVNIVKGVFKNLEGAPALITNAGISKVGPSSSGIGLDESRLVRNAASKLFDPAVINGKGESLATPAAWSSFKTPLVLLGLGWSTTASLSTYPSFKMGRGLILKRPYTGARSELSPLSSVSEAFSAPLLSKNSATVGTPALGLWRNSDLGFATSNPSLDSSLGHWSQVWAVSTPSPAEDLDPTFVNSKWSLEWNTTRRSDHNSRYLVTWSPLVKALTNVGSYGGVSSIDQSQSGPSSRLSVPTVDIRKSILALNEAGLKNTKGAYGVTPVLASLVGPDSGINSTKLTSSGNLTSNQTSEGAISWPELWAFAPTYTTGRRAFVGGPASTYFEEGQALSTLSLRSAAYRGISSSPIFSSAGGARSSLVTLISETDYASPYIGNRLPLDVAAFVGVEIKEKTPKKPFQGYVPLSSNISASKRLRVTKGVTLPSDIPMHIICGSKDVIHSWAIPGLCVKIDCIPGYNSHRRLLLRWRGAYWGQCMEVCGRYHHWMPIMVNVTHPTLFLDWCLTFLRGLDATSRNGGSALSPESLRSLLALLDTFKA
jgi:heme/copper-type cytochrome/quinol oxidase subunit 2